MPKKSKSQAEWKQFEQLVARIEEDASPLGLEVVSPDRIRCKVTGRLREVDASVRARVGTSTVLVTIECRKRRPKQDVTWIEQLSMKKQNIGASHTIAVSSAGFSSEAKTLALHYGIALRRLEEVSAQEINQQLKSIGFVLFNHRRCILARTTIRLFRSLENWSVPNTQQVDMVLPLDTDPHSKIFTNTETGFQWSINDLWMQFQEAVNPFLGIKLGNDPELRTACFPYPGNVTVSTPDGAKRLGDVMLSVALFVEGERVDFDSAKKIEYSDMNGQVLQRVEFTSQEPGSEDWRVSLQLPKDAKNYNQFKTRVQFPKAGQIESDSRI